MASVTQSPKWVPVGLFCLGLISVLFAAMQGTLLSQGEAGLQNEMASPTYFEMPVPIIIHIVCGSLFNLFMPLQFVSSLRSKRPKLHRISGRLLMVCALGFGLSALWMNHVYPQYGGIAKYLGIVAHIIVVGGSLTLGLRAIRQGRVADHKQWMMRLTAAALSPATQRLFIMPLFIIFGEALMLDWVFAATIWFGLVVNMAVAEFFIWRNAKRNSVSLKTAFSS